MREPELSDEEVASLTRTYLIRRTGTPYPRGLESRALGFVHAEQRHSGLSWIIVSAAVTIIAVGAIVVAFAFNRTAAPAPSRSAPVPAPPAAACSAASVHATLANPGTARSASAGGVDLYTTEGVLFTNTSSSGCDLGRPSLLNTSIASKVLPIDNLTKVPARTYLAPGATATLEIGIPVGCATFQAPAVAVGLTVAVPNLGTLTFSGLRLNLWCGAPVILAMQYSPSAPPSASPSVSTATSAPLCLASQVQINYLMGASGAAAGNTSIVLGVRNGSAQPCELRGWPLLQFVGRNGRTLPTHEMQTTSNFFSLRTTLRTVILQAGTAPPQITQPIGSLPIEPKQGSGYGFISIGSSDVVLPCETASSIRVVLPGMRTPVVVSLQVPNAFPNGQVVCSGGTTQALPVES